MILYLILLLLDHLLFKIDVVNSLYFSRIYENLFKMFIEIDIVFEFGENRLDINWQINLPWF